MSLKGKLVTGVVWSFINLFLTRGVSFVSTIVLAKILGPNDFGILGMIAIFIGIGTTLVDSGLASSLIRTPNVDNRDYSTVFFTNLALSVFVYVIMFTIAPLAAQFYNQDILTNVVRVYCLGFVISAFNAVQVAILSKEMKFKEMAKHQIPATFISVFLGIYLAFQGYGVWSLVWMFLTNQFLRTVIFWYKSSWKPSFLFDKQRLFNHFGFGYKLTLSSLLNTGFKNIYNVLIGKFYTIETLGFYERSETFKHYLVSTLTDIISTVSYPLLSNIQENKERMISVFKKIIIFSFFIVSPFMLCIAVISKPLFFILLGEEWMSAVPFFQILCISSVFYPLNFMNINLLKVLGRSDLFLKLEIYKKITLLVIIVIAFQYGIYGLLLSNLVGSLIGFFINSYYSGKLINYGAKRQLSDLLPYFFISLITAILTYLVLIYIDNYSEILQLLILIPLSVSFYISLSYIFKLDAISEALSIIKNRKEIL